ncbi:MAG: hypothetical protein D4S01_01755 [Dehalococcoidia bacterium]|nr:MAG: hypothetical protein D4S01_01755 [Dehalococcoidia bacterium]
MKMNGKTIQGLTPEVIVIPKGETEYVFKAMPILSYDEFEKLCPTPLPPEIIKKGGAKSLDYEDKEYDKLITAWAEKKAAWTTITSLAATPDLEWETVVQGDPATWTNYIAELATAFTDIEISLIIGLTHTACGLDQRKITEATDRFLASQEQAQSM